MFFLIYFLFFGFGKCCWIVLVPVWCFYFGSAGVRLSVRPLVYTATGARTSLHRRRRLLDLEQLHIKGKGGVGRDDTGMATAAVGIVRRADQLGALANAQLGDSLVPAADDLALADGELEGLVAVARRIKLWAIKRSITQFWDIPGDPYLGAIVQGAGVVDRHLLAVLREGAACGRTWNTKMDACERDDHSVDGNFPISAPHTLYAFLRLCLPVFSGLLGQIFTNRSVLTISGSNWNNLYAHFE